MVGGQALLQGVPEHQVALQHLVHELQVGLTGEEEEETVKSGEDTGMIQKLTFLLLFYSSLLRPGEDYLDVDLEHVERL